MLVATVLIVEDNGPLREKTVRIFQKAGYEVLAASNGMEALALVDRQPPDILVTDVVMPRMDGWSLVRRLRSRAGTAFIPVIFLSGLESEEHRMYAFKLGADEYVRKPYKPRELLAKVNDTLARRSQLWHTLQAQGFSRPRGGPPGLHGSLEQLGLASLFTLFEMECRSGRLVLTRADEGQSATAIIREGRIVQARVSDKPKLRGQESVLELLRWDYGIFEFQPGVVGVADEVQSPTAALLLEGARRLDEETGATRERSS